MRDIVMALNQGLATGRSFALATVIAVHGSGPRQAGSAMAVDSNGHVVGSVAGGCVDGAVYQLARDVASTGHPTRVRYGADDTTAGGVGLTCGGEIDVLIEKLDPDRLPLLGALAAAITADEPVATATLVAGDGAPGLRMAIWADRTVGSTGVEGLDAAVRQDARSILQQGTTGMRRYGRHDDGEGGDVEVFVAGFAARPQMLIFGATDFARATAQVGRLLGYRVTVCDARAVFATAERFPEADAVVVDWPHRYLERVALDCRTAICVFTHDAKFDLPLLELALRSDAWYVGAMGSRRTHADRIACLSERGMTGAELARLRSPIGLDLGACTPEETAISIAAQIVAHRGGGSGLPLERTAGPIHRLDHRA